MPSPLFLIFSAATARGRKSAGAAAWMTTSLLSARESTASHSSAQETMGANSTPVGAGRETGPETSVTCAPRSRAASAMAKPILPVERLVRKRTGSSISRVGAGGDKHAATGEVLFFAEDFFDGAQDGLRFLHAAHVLVAAGEMPAGGAAEAHAPGAQAFGVFLRGGVFPHGGVHRRRQQHRAAHGQIRGAEKIVGDAAGELGQRVGRGGRDHETGRPTWPARCARSRRARRRGRYGRDCR